MPAMTKPVNAVTKPLTADAEQSAADWVKGVLDGSGSSPAQMIVGIVIGCIPFVGQAVDIGNIIVTIVKIAEEPNDSGNWIDLVINFVAFVPLFGDALKIAFKQLRHGKSIGAVLDAIPAKKLRGDVETWLRKLDWNAYTKEITGYVDDILSKLIGLFDSWMTRAVMGNARVRKLTQQLQHMQTIANKQIKAAMQSLQQNYQKALATPHPNTTARAPVVAKNVPAKPVVNQTPAPKTQSKGNVHQNTQGNPATTGGQNNSTKRQSSKRSNKELGSGGEHITDYYFVKRKKNRSKISNQGVLFEYNDNGHHGIDHVWHDMRLPYKYRITDSKATNAMSHKKLMTPQAAMAALRMGLDVYMKSDQDNKVKNTVGKKTSYGVPMSHLWISKNIEGAGITSAHKNILSRAIAAWRRVDFKPTAEQVFKDGKGQTVAIRCPYDRSLITITGKLFDHHAHAKGLDLPKCTKSVTAHAITLEFVLPNDMLPE